MPRRHISRSNIELELFPFLSVLACTIGTLILLIIVITIETFGSQREVTIIARNEQGLNQTKTPRYIETRGDGIIIHPQQVFVSVEEIDNPSSPLTELLAEVKENKDSVYLIVAIRPDGIDIFNQVRSYIELQGIDIGYEPIEADWQLKIKEES